MSFCAGFLCCGGKTQDSIDETPRRGEHVADPQASVRANTSPGLEEADEKLSAQGFCCTRYAFTKSLCCASRCSGRSLMLQTSARRLKHEEHTRARKTLIAGSRRGWRRWRKQARQRG
eukprot:3675024-Rhodomonas_salina.1